MNTQFKQTAGGLNQTWYVLQCLTCLWGIYYHHNVQMEYACCTMCLTFQLELKLVLTAVTLIGVLYFPVTEGNPYLLRFGLSSFSPATEYSS